MLAYINSLSTAETLTIIYRVYNAGDPFRLHKIKYMMHLYTESHYRGWPVCMAENPNKIRLYKACPVFYVPRVTNSQYHARPEMWTVKYLIFPLRRHTLWSIGVDVS